MGKKIILINGPSSSGKSTLSKALQELIEERRNERYFIVSIDDFMKLSTDETIYEDDVFEISGDMCTSTLEALKTYPGVIIDHVITSERIYSQLTAMMGQYQICSVHATCPLNVLLQREYARKNRCLGSAESSYKYLFPKAGYDLSVDTSIMTPAECSTKIYGAFFKITDSSLSS